MEKISEKQLAALNYFKQYDFVASDTNDFYFDPPVIFYDAAGYVSAAKIRYYSKALEAKGYTKLEIIK